MNLLAVRSVSETDDVHLLEGLAYPFRGKDTYGTFFSARTNFHWDLFPDVIPGVRSDAGPAFVRPVTYHHGFEREFGLARVGGWSPVRTDADGVWVQTQLDKRQAYYATRIRPLLDAGALGLSGGSAEHSVRIDQRTGEVLEWPAYELALTPVESNPLAQLATRSALNGELLAIRIVSEDAAVRGWLPEGTTQGDLDDGDFAWISDDGKTRKLPFKIHGKVNEAGWKAAWSRAHQEGTNFSGGPSREAVIAKLEKAKPAGVEVEASGQRAAVRGIQTFSDIVASAEMNEELPEAFDTLESAIYSAIWAVDADFNPAPADEKRTAIGTSLEQFRDYILAILDRASRSAPLVARKATRAAPATATPAGEPSADPQPTLRVVRTDADDLKSLGAAFAARANEIGAEVARRLTG